MARKLDLEELLGLMEAEVKAKLNNKLAAITTEKADDFALPTIAEEAYFFQTLEKNRCAMHRAFCFYAVEEPEAEGIGPHTLEDYKIAFVVVLKDTIDAEGFHTRLLRYSRALKEIFEEAYTTNKFRTKIQVSSISPQAFMINGLSDVFKGVGVRIRVVIG